MVLKTILLLLLVVAGLGTVLAQGRHSIPACSQPMASDKLVGFTIKLSVPKDLVVDESQDVDYQVYRIVFVSGNNRFQLSGYSGLNVGTGEVPKRFSTASTEFSRRIWTHNKQRGVDANGKLKGKFWRYFGMFGETLVYEDVSAEAAAFFDRILNSACFVN